MRIVLYIVLVFFGFQMLQTMIHDHPSEEFWPAVARRSLVTVAGVCGGVGDAFGALDKLLYECSCSCSCLGEG